MGNYIQILCNFYSKCKKRGPIVFYPAEWFIANSLLNVHLEVASETKVMALNNILFLHLVTFCVFMPLANIYTLVETYSILL